MFNAVGNIPTVIFIDTPNLSPVMSALPPFRPPLPCTAQALTREAVIQVADTFTVAIY